MHLAPREQEKLLIVVAASPVRGRKDRDIRPNHPEAATYITAETLEGAREGRTAMDLMTYGATLLTYDDVMEDIPEIIRAVQVEAAFPDGTKFVSVHDPIRRRLP